jgi:PIN domain nuclease of toxin-antitoxin system
MRLLLDTHTAIWFFNDDDRLSKKATQAILSPSNLKYVSIASVWEVSIKLSLKKLDFDGKTQGFLDLINENDFELLPIEETYILGLEKLEFIHRDPFDRLLIASSISENMPIITADTNIRLYPVDYIW